MRILWSFVRVVVAVVVVGVLVGAGLLMGIERSARLANEQFRARCEANPWCSEFCRALVEPVR